MFSHYLKEFCNKRIWLVLTGCLVILALTVILTPINIQSSPNLEGVSLNQEAVLVDAPTFWPPPGTYNYSLSVAIKCTTTESIIRYTTDGSDPNSYSTVFGVPLKLTNTSTTIKAKAFKAGMSDSPVVSATYIINVFETTSSTFAEVTPDAPTFSPAPGTYSGSQNVSIVSHTDMAAMGTAVQYTTDGIESIWNSPIYINPIPINKTTIINAIVTVWYKSDTPLTLVECISPIASATYVINPPSVAKLAPVSPTNLSITAVSLTQVKLTWKDNSSNETSFEIYRQQINTKIPSANMLVGKVNANIVTFTDTGLNPNATYRYQVYSVNATGRSDFFASIQFTTSD